MRRWPIFGGLGGGMCRALLRAGSKWRALVPNMANPRGGRKLVSNIFITFDRLSGILTLDFATYQHR